MTHPPRSRPLLRLLPLAAAAALAAPARAEAPPQPEPAKVEPALAPARAEAGEPATNGPAAHPIDEIPETPISVPPPVPTGILIAWKPMILSVRVDSGEGNKFGSDKLQPLRFLVRYTKLFDENQPFVGRIELEGGQFKSDSENDNIGSVGTDFTARALLGAATRISQGFTVLGSVGLISRYQNGKASGGAPTIGIFGAVTNMELEFRVQPTITLSLFAEAALAPFPYYAQTNLGDLSDSSEFRARIQVSFDLTRSAALDIGYDFTRWHGTFTQSTILGPSNPSHALILEDREYALTMGVRWKL